MNTINTNIINMKLFPFIKTIFRCQKCIKSKCWQKMNEQKYIYSKISNNLTLNNRVELYHLQARSERAWFVFDFCQIFASYLLK